MRRRKIKRLSLFTDVIILGITLITVVFFAQKLNIVDFSQKNDYPQILALADDSKNIQDVSLQNKLSVESIKKKYGINIEYGADVKQIAEKVSATSLDNENIINNNINNIKTELEKYPDNFFINMNTNNKYAFTVILLNKFSDDNLALASRNSLNEYRIYISNTENFSRAFEHELFHVIEYYMTYKSQNNNLFVNWDKLNPNNFEYNDDIYSLTSYYVYTDTFSLKNAYFVSKYAKTSEKEDRAETFAELMTQKNKPLYFNKNEHIYMKAKYISDIIGQNFSFNEAQEKLYWNKYLF